MSSSEPARPVRLVARSLIARDISVVPIPRGKKGAVLDDWNSLRITAEQVDKYFHPNSNIGVLCGERSGHLIDVDFDCAEAVALAPEFLPPTDVKTGRDSRPESHWWFRCPGMESLQRRDPETNEMIVEVRCTGLSTVVGPSIHPEGDRYHELHGDPPDVESSVLAAAVNSLADAVLTQRYGYVPLAKKDRVPKVVRSGPLIAGDYTEQQKLDRARKYLSRMPEAIEGAGGHNATYAAACAMVHGFELDVPTALSLMLTDYNSRCQPPWSHKELLHKCEDAETKPHDRERGWLLRSPNPSSNSRIVQREAHMNSPAPDVPQILIGTDEHRVIDETIAALSTDPSLYQRDHSLVRILRDSGKGRGVRRENALVIAPVVPAYLRDRITLHASLFRLNGATQIPTSPKPWLIEGVLARKEWPGFRHLSGVSDIPLLRANGTVFDTPGFDEQTGYVYQPLGTPIGLLANPTHEDVVAAVALLCGLFHDFPFADLAHRAALIAGLLSVIARTAYDGPTPLFLVTANVPGAGKTLLCQLILVILFGGTKAVSSYTHDDEEMRKRITSIVMSGDQIVLLDNVRGKFGNASLERALTSMSWNDRLLGENRSVSLPLRAIWFATGNTVQTVGDIGRRLIRCDLHTLEEEPERRTGFKHPRILEHAIQNRSDLLRAAYTILQAYILAGKPPQNLTPMGSYEGWSDLVRSALVWAGLPDPASTRPDLRITADADIQLLRDLLEAWIDVIGVNEPVSLQQLIDRLYTKKPSAAEIDFRAILEELTPVGTDGRPNARLLGIQLRTRRRRCVNGMYLDVDESRKSRGGVRWVVVAKPQPEAK